MNEIFHILMYKCIHKPIHHTQTPKIPRAFTFEPAWQSSNHHIQKFAELAKHLEKLLMFESTNCKDMILGFDSDTSHCGCTVLQLPSEMNSYHSQ